MSRALIEKARERRLRALWHVQQKSTPAAMERGFDIRNVFDISNQGSTAENVIAFRNQLIHEKPAVQGSRHFH